MSYFRLFVFLCLVGNTAAADTAVAVLTHAGNAQIVRNKDKSSLTAVDGEMLFDGDSLSIPSGVQGSAEFIACSAGASKTYRLTSGQAEFHGGKITGAGEVAGSSSLCLLPDIEQDPAIGMMTERSLDSPKPEAPVSAADLARLSP